MARMLTCNGCGILWRLSNYDGEAEYDMELRHIIDRHLAMATDPRPESHKSNVYHIDDKDANLIDIESAVQKKLAEQGVWIKETRDDLKVEAVKCFNKHMRPQGGCIDWLDDSKIIGRKTGVPKENRQYLCKYCPAAEHYVHRARKAKGMYGS